MALISLSEYAEKRGKILSAVRSKAAKGDFAAAKMIGRNWVIDSEEPYVDNRVKSGAYRNWRKKTKEG